MSVPAVSPTLLQTRQHFKILDGLRGIAAVSVVIFHFMEFVTPDYKDNFIAHAYLAVDFFFCLSGFVIAYAYDTRLKQIGVLNFFKLRLIRLHPLVLIGSVIGLLAFVFDPFSNLYSLYSGKTLQLFLASCLMIPYPVVPERYFNLFHLNPPAWSLFWEYVANIFYALVLVRLRNKFLWVLTLLAAAALFYEAYDSRFLGVGFGGDNVRAGGIRVAFSFLAGMLVYRSNWIIRNRFGFGGLGLLLFIVFLVPYADATNWLVEPLMVVLYFPFLLALGVGAVLSPRWEKLCRFSGDISYPLYMVHYPFLWLFLSYIEVHKPGMGQMTIITIIGVPVLIGLAYLVMVLLDLPLRKWLRRQV
ncbi:MAG: acyltransferase [Candidatus Pseudobacter hemicellulosilyticus]|uniref:Acyltransferase n=1 Tax=Candidatus Pseudobacter hemicellulosilyticus TaxID=3121375 RepID=A0AAJ6BHA7_9BACT|nr:MAG: acyltransferase [Pseudobacter sp.]